MISLIVDPQLAYPGAEQFFSPERRYPEYRFSHISPQKNGVYRAVRECLAQAGLDASHRETPEWNPLGGWIKPGNRVFILCNFVLHRDPHESPASFQAKCLHASVLRPVLDYFP